jgi:hypothetical protein
MKPSAPLPLPSHLAPVLWNRSTALLGSLRFAALPLVFVLAVSACSVFLNRDIPDSPSPSQDIRLLHENIRLLSESVATLREGVGLLRAGIEEVRHENQARQVTSQTNWQKTWQGRLERDSEEMRARMVELTQKIAVLTGSATVKVQDAPSFSRSSEMLPPVATLLPPPRPQQIAQSINPVRLWRMRGFDGEYALIESTQGLMDVRVGQIIPGVGKVEAITRRGRDWVVVTQRGLIRPSQTLARSQPLSTWSKGQ